MTHLTAQDRSHLLHAARLALRGHGGAEPNPLVGCVIVSPFGRTVGWGYHRRCGEAHAEIHALARAGKDARGATVYLTLEPCDHQGRTAPCTDALIEAGVARVVITRRDPNPIAAGGIDRLRRSGIDVSVVEDLEPAMMISDAFVRRVRSGLPWVIAKWAQTIDGRIATRTGASQWISNEASRRMVHRERGRVDAILTSVGTVLADDPLLTARGVRRRRIARRVVIDPHLKTPGDAQVVQTAHEVPTLIACATSTRDADPDHVAGLERAGVDVLAFTLDHDELPMEAVLRTLVERYDVTNVLTEAGPGLLGRLFRDNLVNDAWVFTASLLLGDEKARTCVEGLTAPNLTDGIPMRLLHSRRRGHDLIQHYRVSQ